MSLAAMSWALDRAELSTSAKMVLAVIGESANMHRSHVCDYHTQDTLAARASMSVDVFQRRIKELADRDLLFVVKRRANDGSIAKNYYVVLIDDEARAHAAAFGWQPHDGAHDDAGNDAPEGGAGEDGENCTVDASHAANRGMAETGRPCRKSNDAMPQLRGKAYKEGPGIDLESPPTPQGGRGEGDASLSEKDGAEPSGETRRRDPRALDAARVDRWRAFERLWPWDATELPGDARGVFLRLTDDEQALAIAAAPGYVAACKTRNSSARNHGIAHAAKWLRGEGWKASKARSVDSAASIGGVPVFIEFGSAQFWRWVEYHQAAKDVRLMPRTRSGHFPTPSDEQILMPLIFESKGRRGFARPSEWPPPLPEK